MKARADYIYHVDATDKPHVLVIEDINTGSASVTNDIENVVADIAERSGLLVDKLPIIYRDSEGVFDGWDVTKGEFIKLNCSLDDDAVKEARVLWVRDKEDRQPRSMHWYFIGS
jgi:hypothetical protein